MRFDCVHPQVREDKDRGIYVEGLTEHPVDAPDAVLALVHESATNRATCGTSMNRTSSRSHALLLLRVEQWTESTDEAAADLAAIQTGDEALSDRSSVVSASAPRIAVRRGLLSIVDLAGSERVCKSGSEVRLSPPISPPISPQSRLQSRPNLASNLASQLHIDFGKALLALLRELARAHLISMPPGADARLERHRIEEALITGECF